MKANLLERYGSKLASTSNRRKSLRDDDGRRRILFNLTAADCVEELTERHGFDKDWFTFSNEGNVATVREEAIRHFIKLLCREEFLHFDGEDTKRYMLIWLLFRDESPLEQDMVSPDKSNLRRDGLAAILRYCIVNEVSQ